MSEKITIKTGCPFIRRLKTRVARTVPNGYGGSKTLDYRVDRGEYERELLAFKVRERKRKEGNGPELQRDIEEDHRREMRITREDLLYDDGLRKYFDVDAMLED